MQNSNRISYDYKNMPILYSDNPNNETRNPKPVPQKNKKKAKKLDFKTLKKNTINSLYDVEYFLNNIQQITKCIKLYKLLK